MPLKNISIRPGIVRDVTNYTNTGGWYDGDKVRFRMGMPQTIGGWEKYSPAQYLGACRALHQWTANDGIQYTAMGTNLKLYVENSGTFYDITPIRRSLTLGNNPFATQQIGNGRITVTDAGHGALAGDFVTFSGATGFNAYSAGNLNREFQIVEVYDSSTYCIDVVTPVSTAVVSGGGASVVASYQINTGLESQTVGTGYGTGPYSRGTWSSPSTFGFSQGQLRTWSLVSFGEDLVAAIMGGGIYYWDKTNGTSTRAVALSSLPGSNQCPTVCTGVAISEQDRHLIVFGANPNGSSTQDPLLIRWCDQENVFEWEPRPNTTAGFQRVSSGSLIVGWTRGRKETLIWTDTGVASISFSGPPFTFSVTSPSAGASIIGPNASATAQDTTYWMDAKSFRLHNGSVNALPCPVQDYVFDDFNFDQRYKVFAAVNSLFNEIWWFYPSAGSLNNNRYVTYNYVDNAWSIGTLARDAWYDQSFTGLPISAGGGYLYLQEFGRNADSAPMNAYIEGSDLTLFEGDSYTFIGRVLPDIMQLGDRFASVTMTIKQRDFPAFSSTTAFEKTFMVGATGTLYPRLRTRQFAIRVSSNQINTGWRLGTTRFELQPDGRKS